MNERLKCHWAEMESARVHGAKKLGLVGVHVGHNSTDGTHHVRIQRGANKDATNDVGTLQCCLWCYVSIPAAHKRC